MTVAEQITDEQITDRLEASEKAVPPLPVPRCTFADHSYPAFTASQMYEYAQTVNAALLTELQHRREAEAGTLNVRDEIVTRILDLSVIGKALSGFTDVEGDIFADELRGIVTNAIADTPAPRAVEQCLSIIDQMEMEWRAKGWDDEAAAACDIAARIKATPRAASPSSPASVTCVFCAKELGDDAVSDEAGALAHPVCAEIELLTQKVEQYAAFVKLVDQSPHPERMSGAHLSKEARAQAAFAVIDNFKRQAAALSALGEHP